MNKPLRLSFKRTPYLYPANKSLNVSETAPFRSESVLPEPSSSSTVTVLLTFLYFTRNFIILSRSSAEDFVPVKVYQHLHFLPRNIKEFQIIRIIFLLFGIIFLYPKSNGFDSVLPDIFSLQIWGFFKKED